MHPIWQQKYKIKMTIHHTLNKKTHFSKHLSYAFHLSMNLPTYYPSKNMIFCSKTNFPTFLYRIFISLINKQSFLISIEQFQSLFQQAMHQNREQQLSQNIQIGQRLIEEVISDNLQEIRSVDDNISQLMGRIFIQLCTKINSECDRFRQESNELKDENVNLQMMLQDLTSKLQTAINENLQAKHELQQLINQYELRYSEYAAEINESKYQIQTSKQNILQYENSREKVQELFKSYEIKIREIEQQKLFLSNNLAREQNKRKGLEDKLNEIQDQLIKLSLQYQNLERSYGELSISLESREEKIKHLNKIIEESQYMSSLSPHSRIRAENNIQEEEISLSQQSHKVIKTTLEDDPVIRLSHSYLPAQKSESQISKSANSDASLEDKKEEIKYLEIPKKIERLISQQKRGKKVVKNVLSHQKKPSKQDLSLKKEIQKPKTIALSKKQCSQAVKSKLSSIFKERLQYKSQNDQKFESKISQLKQSIKVKDTLVNKLKSEISFLKTVKIQPIAIPNSSRSVKNTIYELRSENESLNRMTRQLVMRKAIVEDELEEYKDKYVYYKAQYRKIYEKYLLKNAESVAYEEQLSFLEQEIKIANEKEENVFRVLETSRKSKDEFQNLSQKLNNLAINHDHVCVGEDPSFKSGKEMEMKVERKEFYSMQNINSEVNQSDDRTLQNEKKFQVKLCESVENSPAKAVLNGNSHQIQDFILNGIEEIKPKQSAVNLEAYTERLLLTQLMQSSRRKNSMSQFQLFFSQPTAKKLKLVSYGCLAYYKGRIGILSLKRLQSIEIAPKFRNNSIKIYQTASIIIYPVEKEKCSVLVGVEIELREKLCQTQNIITKDKQVSAIEEVKHFGMMHSPSVKNVEMITEIVRMRNEESNTNVVQSCELGIQVKSEWKQFGFSSDLQTKEMGTNKEIDIKNVGINVNVQTNNIGVGMGMETKDYGISNSVQTNDMGTSIDEETKDIQISSFIENFEREMNRDIKTKDFGFSSSIQTAEKEVSNCVQTLQMGIGMEIKTEDFGFSSSIQTAQTATNLYIQTSEFGMFTSTLTNQFAISAIVQTSQIGVSIVKQTSDCGISHFIQSTEIGVSTMVYSCEVATETIMATLQSFTNTYNPEFQSLSINTDEVSRQSIQIQSDSTKYKSLSTETETLLMTSQQTNTIQLTISDYCLQTTLKELSLTSIQIFNSNVLKRTIEQTVQTQLNVGKLNLVSFSILNETIQKSHLSIVQTNNFQYLGHSTRELHIITNYSLIIQSERPTNNLTITKPQVGQVSYQIVIHPVKLIHSLFDDEDDRKNMIEANKKCSNVAVANNFQLNLSFLNKMKKDEEAISSDSFKSITSFCTILEEDYKMNEKNQEITHELAIREKTQMNSGRTRSSSQQLHSHRSEKLGEVDKKNEARKSSPREVIKESMISQNSSNEDITSNQAQEICRSFEGKIKEEKTCSHTPAEKEPNAIFKNIMEPAVLPYHNNYDEEQQNKQNQDLLQEGEAFSNIQLDIIKDYFYQLENFSQQHSYQLTEKHKYLHTYELNDNMHVFHAYKDERFEKFVVWRGKVIHFGQKFEFMELLNNKKSSKIVKGKSVSLGNCEFRIFEDKLQINRIQKRKCFKGEMQNGQWKIQNVWTFETN